MDINEAVDAAGDAIEDMNSEALQLALDDSQAEIIKLREENKALKAERAAFAQRRPEVLVENKRLREALGLAEDGLAAAQGDIVHEGELDRRACQRRYQRALTSVRVALRGRETQCGS